MGTGAAVAAAVAVGAVGGGIGLYFLLKGTGPAPKLNLTVNGTTNVTTGPTGTLDYDCQGGTPNGPAWVLFSVSPTPPSNPTGTQCAPADDCPPANFDANGNLNGGGPLHNPPSLFYTWIYDPTANAVSNMVTVTVEGGGGGPVLFSISGQVGSLSLNCACAPVDNDLTLQVAQATPGGVVQFFLAIVAPDSGDWIPLQQFTGPGGGQAPVEATADAYGDVSLSVTSCELLVIAPSGTPLGGCGNPTCYPVAGCIYPLCGGPPAGTPLYLVALDTQSGTYSNVIVVTPSCNCQSCSQGDPCCA
jgi:hypothetical protein